MDSIYQVKEAYEVDPNSSFNKLKKLQLALKEEVALNDIYFENRDNLLKKIDKNCFEYFQKRMSIQEIYDHSKLDLTDNNNKRKIKYIVSEKPQNELTQCFDPIYKMMFYFRESNELLLKLINHCPKENFEQLANFLCNYFYVNIFSSSFLNENLLTLIYILLEKEVDKINNITSFVSFLDPTQIFVAQLLRCLSRKDEVKAYLEKILKKSLIRTGGMLRNQNNNLFIGFDIKRIATLLKQGEYNFERTEKPISSIKNLITSNINKSRLNIVDKKNVNNNEDKMKSDRDNNKEILSNSEIENNIWVQVTKETFDDLLLGNENKDNIDNIFSNKSNPSEINNSNININHDDLEKYFINSGYFIKTEETKKKERDKKFSILPNKHPKINLKSNHDDDNNEDGNSQKFKTTSVLKPIEENEVNNEDKPAEEKETVLESNKDKNITNDDVNELYSKELDKETLLDLLDKQTSPDMEEYILNQLKLLEKEGISFSNEKLITEIAKSSKTGKTQEKISLAFKYNFECIKEFLDEIFFSLIKNMDNIPYIIRAVCTILARLIKIKFPNITTIQIIPFLSEFIFTNLIIHILVNPKFNGIMLFDFSIDKILLNERNKKIIAMNKVLKKLLRGQLYENSDNEYSYTLFNAYFIEIMPYVIDFFNNLTSVKLPTNIEQLLEEKQKLHSSNTLHGSNTLKEEKEVELKKTMTVAVSNPLVPNSSVSKEFNFLKMHPEERIEHQSFCLNYRDILMIYNIILPNEEKIVGDPNGILYKTYKKLSFHEENIKKKMEKEEDEGKRTFLCMTKLVMDDKLKEKINEKKDKKFSFQESSSINDSNKENFILQRVKYSINTIIKHLNILKRTNFYLDENESTENFVIGLNKMISMEGFSEMLKEKKLPLEWFGLYLQSNIENIPENYRKDNYALLYNELLKESIENLEKIKNDDSLNIIYNKIINSEKMIDISSNGLKRITNNRKKFEIFFFILKMEIPIIMVIHYKKNSEIIKKIELEKKELQPVPKKKLFSFAFKEDLNVGEIKKFECKNILEFCDYFPNLKSDFFNDLFGFEEEIQLKSFLDEYFKIINEYVIKEEMFSEYESEEKKNIQQQIENYIHCQIYHKIFGSKPLENDKKITEICEKYNWIKASNINEKIKYDDEKMVQIMVHFAKNMENEMSPANKIHEFEIIDMIINNIINIYGYEESYYNSLLTYVFIKAKPKYLDSSLKYINTYLDEDLKNPYNNLLKKLTKLVKSITEFKKEENKQDVFVIYEDHF